MTVAVLPRVAQWNTTGATPGPFAVPFGFFELAVYLDDALVSPSDYTIDQDTPGGPGDVYFDTNPTGALRIVGATEMRQDTDYISVDEVEPETTEQSFDRLTMIAQEIQQFVEAVKAQQDDQLDEIENFSDLASASAVASAASAIDSAGSAASSLTAKNNAETAETNAEAAATLAEGYALAAEGYAAAAADMPEFVGDSGSGGVKGFVPAPGAGDAALGKVLGAGGGWVDVAGLPVVAGRSVLAALSVTTPLAYLSEGLRSGLFLLREIASLSDEETDGFAADSEEGIFVQSTDDAAYVWVRDYEQAVPRFFGAVPYPDGNPTTNVTAVQAAVDFAMATDDPLWFDDLYETDGTVDLTGRVNIDGAGNRTGLCFEGAVVGMEIKVAANRPGGSAAIFQGGSIKNIGFWSLDGAAGSEGVRISGNNGVYMTFWDIDVWGHGVEIVIHHTRTTNIGAPFYVIPGSDCNFTAHALPNDQFNGGGGYTTYPSRAIKFDAGCAAHQILQVPHAHIANGGIVIEMGDGTGGLGDLLVMPGHWLCPTGTGTGIKITGPSDLSRYREHMSFIGLDFDGGITTAFDLTRVKKFTIDESCTWGYGVVNALNACTEYTMHRNSFRQEHGRQILVLGSGSQTLTLATLASAISAQYGGGYVEAICNGFVAGVGAFSGTIRARWVWNNGTLSLTAESVTMVGTTPPTLAITASTNSIVVTLLMAPTGANSEVHFQLNTYGPAIAVALTSNVNTTE